VALLFIGKYPPIVGGVSSLLFWKTLLLARTGIEVCVLSCAQQAQKKHRLIWSDQAPSNDNLNIYCLNDIYEANVIPHSPALATRLASLACHIVTKHTVDLIEGVYMEPNALVAAIVSQWFQIPYGIKHAGSDVGRLLNNPEYTDALKMLLKKANYILTGANHFQRFYKMQISRSCLLEDPYVYPVREYFSPEGETINLNEFAGLVEKLKPPMLNGLIYYQGLARKNLDLSLPTIGIYGKASHYKGHHSLLDSLKKLKHDGYQFNLAIIIQGHEGFIANIYQKIVSHELEENTLLLPFIANNDIPRFIRACDAVCYLENNFPIAQHDNAKVPLEVLFCGRHLIVSDEVASHPRLSAIYNFIKYCTIVSMRKKNDLYHKLKHYLMNVEAYRKKSLLLYEQFCLSSNMDTNVQAQNLADWYVQLKNATKLCQQRPSTSSH
jgi:glycosyltransferase involved in cell wall biosynthesis